MTDKRCRFCYTSLVDTVVDLGMSPLSNSYISVNQLNAKEVFYPLHAYVCPKCFLVQLEEFESPDAIFSDYAYFSSYSESWLNHARQYTEMINKRFAMTNESLVVEIASNDGYLLQYFKEKGIQVLGIEPAVNVAKVAIERGIPTITEFFGKVLAKKLRDDGVKADLLLGNNVLAHVPDINDFVAGMKEVLKPQGIVTMEFPHLLRLMEENQFDTIYHEHFSYLSFGTVQRIFAAHGLAIFDVEELPTHGGSIRVYACHCEDKSKNISLSVHQMIMSEESFGLKRIETYKGFEQSVKRIKREILDIVIRIKSNGKSIVGYGAPAKGNTLLNYCGIRTDFIDYTVDKNPYKQGLYLPGTHIPIYSPEKILETKPDFVMILPWNIKDEIMEQLNYIREWNGKFLILIPTVQVI